MASPTAELRLTARDETQAAFNSALAGLRGLGDQARSLGSIFQQALGAASLGFGLKAIFDQAVEAERAQSRLAAVLKSTGYAAGLTATQINNLAESLAKSTTFDDDALRQGIASLLRFRDVQGDTFRRAAELATDLAVSTGDLGSAFVTLGRLGNEPTASLKALVSQGFDLKQSQIDLAKQLEETGDKAGAQKVAFDELARSIGGAAQGDNAGLYGASKSVGKAWDDMLKAFGRSDAVGGVAVWVMNALTNALEELQIVINQPGWDNKLKLILASDGGDLRAVAEALKKRSGASGSWGPTAEEERAAAGAQARADERMWESAKADDERITKWLDENSKKRIAAGKSAAEEARRQKEKQLQESIDIYKRQLDAEEEFYADSSEALNIYNKNKAELMAQAQATATQNQLDFAGVSDLGKFRDVSEGWGDSFGKPVRDEIEKTSDTMRSLGVTFQSAFEDAIIEGESFSKVLQGIEKDLLRLAARKLVTEPLFNVGAGLLGELGKLFLTKSAQGNVMTGDGPLQLERFAGGGVAKRPMLSLFGEGSTPEAYVPLPDGRSIPVTMRGAGGGGMVNNVSININANGGGRSNTQGDDGSVAARLARNLESAVKQVLIGERRPGGLLHGA